MSNFIGDNVNAIRIHFGLNQEKLAELMGVSQTTVSAWECGESTPRRNNVEKLLRVLPGISYDDVMSESNGFAKRVLKKAQGWVKVPLFGRIAAGTPLEMDNVDDFGEVPAPVMSRYPNAFLLRVEGESMNRSIPNGAFALVDPCDDVERDGKPYAVCVNGHDATIKRVRKLENGFELAPDSSDPTFKPIVYDRGNPEDEEITVVGRVVYHVIPIDWEY